MKNRLVNNSIYIAVKDQRNQLLNRMLGIVRIPSLIRNALKNTSKVRKETKPSIAGQNRRLDSKKKGRTKEESTQKILDLH